MATATVTPIRRHQPESQILTIKDYLTHLLTQIEQVSRPSRFARFYTWTKIELFWRGQQLIWFNPDSQRYEPMDDEDTDLYFINNLMYPFMEQISAEYGKSNPQLVAYSTAGYDTKITAAIDHAQYLAECFQQSLWTPEDLQREAKIVQCRTACFTRTWFDPNGGSVVDAPQFQQQMMDMGMGQEMEMLAAVNSSRRRTGAYRSDPIDPLEIEVWDRASNLQQTPFLIWDRAELRAKVMKENPHLEDGQIPKRDSDKNMLFASGLAFKRQLELAVGNTGELDANTSTNYGGYAYQSEGGVFDDLTVRATDAFLRTVLLDFVTKQEERLPGIEQPIPAGVKLSEIFDEGLVVSKVNGEIVAYRNQSLDAEFDCYKYTVPAAGFYGVGSENMLAQQEGFNEMNSLLMASALYASNGITVANSQYIRNGTVLNKPGTVVPAEDLLPGEDLDNVLKHITTSGFDASMMQLPEFLKASMQFTSGARSSDVSGVPSPGIKTATGVNAMKATADSFSSQRLELRAWNRARRMEQAVKLFQDHAVDPIYFSKFGDTRGRWLQAFDIGAEIKFRVEQDSHQPRTNQDMRMDTSAALGMGYGLDAATGTMKPEVIRHVGKIFHMPEGLDKQSDWDVLGQQRLDAMTEAAEQAARVMEVNGIQPEQSQPFVLQEVLLVAQPDELDDHAALSQFYRDYYLSDAYQEADDVIKAAIHELVRLHEMGGVQEAQKQTEMVIAAQEPAMALEEEKQNEMIGQQQEAEGLNAERESESQQLQSEEAEKQREHESSEADKEREHQVEIEKVRAKNKAKDSE